MKSPQTPLSVTAPDVGSRWTRDDWPHGTVVKVLGVVDGWVVARHKRAMPFLRHVNQWHAGFIPAPPLKPKKTP